MSTLSGLTGEALSDALRDLDAGKVPIWDEESLPAPVLAYWGLPEGTSMRTLLLVMRADLNARMIINQGADFRSLRLVRPAAHLKHQQTTCKGSSFLHRIFESLMCLHHMSFRVLSALPESITIMHHLLVVQKG